MLSEPTRDTLKDERILKVPPSKKQPKDAKQSKGQVSDWWYNAGIILRPSLPFCATTGEGTKAKHGKVSLPFMHYLLTHVLLDDISRFLGDRTHPDRRDAPQKLQYRDFFTACRDSETRMQAPWSTSAALEVGTASAKPFQCLRYLALIEMTDKTFTGLPLDQETLLKELETYRANETCQCHMVEDMQEAAVERLVEYSKVQAST